MLGGDGHSSLSFGLRNPSCLSITCCTHSVIIAPPQSPACLPPSLPLSPSSSSIKSTNLLRVLALVPAPADAAVCRHQDGEAGAGRLLETEGLRVEGGLQGLQADQVFELEVTRRGPALAELLNEALEAEADSLARQKVAVLDLSPHVLRQKGLVAIWVGGGGKEQ